MAVDLPGTQSAPHSATRARSGFSACLIVLAGYILADDAKITCCGVRAVNCETGSAPDQEKSREVYFCAAIWKVRFHTVCLNFRAELQT
jgi:hypothetical protein